MRQVPWQWNNGNALVCILGSRKPFEGKVSGKPSEEVVDYLTVLGSFKGEEATNRAAEAMGREPLAP